MLRILLLGIPVVFLNDEPVQIQRKLQRALLFFLACQEAPVSRSDLILMFWPDSAEKDARRHLREALSKLRQELPDKNLLITGQDSVTLDFSRVWVDVKVLRQSTHRIWPLLHLVPLNSPLPSAVASELKEMANLWRGERFMAGIHLPESEALDSWLMSQTQELDYIRQRTLERLGYHMAATGDLEAGIQYMYAVLKNDEQNETLHLQVLTWLQAAGLQSSVETYCEYLKSIYNEENGVPLPAGLERFCQKFRESSTPPRNIQPQSWAVFPDLYVPFVGREGLLKTLRLAFQRGGSAVIFGETGSGKTRLVQQLFVSLQSEPRLLLAPSRSAERTLPFHPLIEMLRNSVTQEEWRELPRAWAASLAWILPELLTLRPEIQPPASTVEDARSQIFEALHQLLKQIIRTRRVLFFLDDAQWSDEATLAALAYLQNHDFFNSRGLLVLAISPEEMSAELQDFINVMERQTHLDQHHLTELLPEDVFELSRYFLGQDPSDRLVERLVRDTGGNPLFVIETLRALLDNVPDPTSASAIDELPLASSIYSLVRVRLRGLGQQCRLTLEAAAVTGHSFTPELLELILNASPEQIADDLDELQGRQLIRPDEHNKVRSGYVFVQDIFREVLQRELSPARRRLLHLRVAQGLEAQYGGQTESSSAMLADHYETAGQTSRACQYWIMAAEYARRLFSPTEAVAAYRRAERLVRLDRTPVSEKSILKVYTGLADVDYENGNLDNMLNAYTVLQHYGEQRASLLLLGSAYSGRALVFYLKGDLQTAQAEIEIAIQFLQSAGDRQELIKAYIRRGSIWQAVFKLQDAAAELQKAVELGHSEFEPDLARTAAVALDRLAILYHVTGWPEKAVEQCQHSLRHNRTLGPSDNSLMTTSILAVEYQLMGDYSRAMELSMKGLEQANQYGQWRSGGLLHMTAGWILMLRGQLDECWTHILYTEEHKRRFGSLDMLGESLTIRGGFFMSMDSFKDAADAFRASMKEAGQNEYLMVFAQFYLGFCLGQLGNITAGLSLLDQAVAFARQNELGRILVQGRLYHAVLVGQLGFTAASRDELTWTLHETRQRKLESIEVITILRLGELDFREGQLDDALEKAEWVIQRSQQQGDRLHELGGLRLAILTRQSQDCASSTYKARMREILAEIDRGTRLEAVRPYFERLKSYYLESLASE